MFEELDEFCNELVRKNIIEPMDPTFIGFYKQQKNELFLEGDFSVSDLRTIADTLEKIQEHYKQKG